MFSAYPEWWEESKRRHIDLKHFSLISSLLNPNSAFLKQQIYIIQQIRHVKTNNTNQVTKILKQAYLLYRRCSYQRVQQTATNIPNSKPILAHLSQQPSLENDKVSYSLKASFPFTARKKLASLLFYHNQSSTIWRKRSMWELILHRS